MGLSLKGEVDGWEALMIYVFKYNVRDMELEDILRRYLLLESIEYTQFHDNA